MNTFFISILTATNQPHTVDLRTRSQYHMSYSHNTGMRTRRPQIGVRLAPHAAHAATAGPHAHSAHPGDRHQRRQDFQSAVALADENKLCGLITALGGALHHDAAAAPRRCWAALSAVRDAHSMCTIGREQQRQVPRSKVERRLRLAAPQIQARGECGLNHRFASTG